MIFVPTPIDGAFLIDVEPLRDERGMFARSFCQKQFEERGLNPHIAQVNISHNQYRATLRGLHWLAAPAMEAKVVRCTRGVIYDVIVDTRLGSPTYRRWFGVELSAEKHNMLYVPELVAHGFVTLTDDTELLYLTSQFYDGSCVRYLRWDDPDIGIEWPIRENLIMSDRDRQAPRLRDVVSVS